MRELLLASFVLPIIRGKIMLSKFHHEEKESFSYLLERSVIKCEKCGAYKGSRQWHEECPKYTPPQAPDFIGEGEL